MSATRRANTTPVRDRHWPIGCLPGLADQAQQNLHQLGIHTTGDLLAFGKTPEQRQAIATRLQLHLHYVNKWVALANLACIPKVGCDYCGLLLHAGISSPEQLAQTPPHRVYQQILKLQVAMLQRQDLCPSLEEIADWSQQARSLVQHRRRQR